MSGHRRFLALEHEVSLILAETSAVAEAYPNTATRTLIASRSWTRVYGRAKFAS